MVKVNECKLLEFTLNSPVSERKRDCFDIDIVI